MLEMLKMLNMIESIIKKKQKQKIQIRENGEWLIANFKKRMVYWINVGSRGRAVITAGLIKVTRYISHKAK